MARLQLASYPGLQRGGKARYTLSAHARNYILRDVNAVDREIFSCRNFRLLNFRVKICSSLQHTDEI